jgi:hypothetical protein
LNPLSAALSASIFAIADFADAKYLLYLVDHSSIDFILVPNSAFRLSKL